MEVSTTAVLIGTAILASLIIVFGLRYLVRERRSAKRIQRRIDAIAKGRSPVDRRLDAVILGDTPRGPIGRVSTGKQPLDDPQLIG